MGAGWWEVDYKWSAWGDEVVGVVDTGQVLALQSKGIPRERIIRGNERSLRRKLSLKGFGETTAKKHGGAITIT